jgi:hypothetical protein
MVGCGCGPMDAAPVASSSWTPAELDLVWSLDAADASEAGGTLTMLDGSGNGHDASGATFPAIDVFPGTAEPALLFNGTTHHLDSATGGACVVGQIYTFVYVVEYADDLSRFVAHLLTGAAGCAAGQGLGTAGPVLWKLGVAFDGDTTPIGGAPVYVEHVFRVGAAHASQLRVNGVVVATADAAAQITSDGIDTGFGIGWVPAALSFYFKGYFGEAFLVLGALTTPQRSSMAGYMAARWGIS